MYTTKFKIFYVFCLMFLLIMSISCGGGGKDKSGDVANQGNGDNDAPIVESVTPEDGATNVAVDTNIKVVFNKAMSATSISDVTFIVEGVSGLLRSKGTTATFIPSEPLAYNTKYTAKITTGAKDAAGNGLKSDYSWSFTTGIEIDTVPPRITSFNPLNDAIDISINSKIEATFNEPMDELTINDSTFQVIGVKGTVTYNSTNAIFAPNVPLAYKTKYIATITTGAKDKSGNGLVSNLIWSFTTQTDTTLPIIISTNPLNDAKDLPIDTIINATFSKAMDSSSLVSSFTIDGVSGSVAYRDNTATFIPSSVVLAYNKKYTAKITTGAKDLFGNKLASNYSWNFETRMAPDTTLPKVASVSPANNAVDVLLDTVITAKFSEAMDSSTINDGTFIIDGVTGRITYSGLDAIFTPSSLLDYKTKYTAKIKTGAKDKAGNGLLSDYIWSFTTVTDKTRPTVLSVEPTDNATYVSRDIVISAAFSKAMDTSTINTSTFKIDGVSGKVAYSGTTATFTPSALLDYDKQYTATITTGVKDKFGNTLAVNYVWKFKTMLLPDTAPPTVTSTNPANNAINVLNNAKITVTFSEAMDSSSINSSTFTIGGVSGAVTYSGITATFTPSTLLAYNTNYTATITTGAKDKSGKAFESNYVWNFKTITAALDTTPPTVTTPNPASNAINIPNDTNITATFSELMDSTTINNTTFTINGVTGIVTYSSNIATFDPITLLTYNTQYTATITTGAKDKAGNPLAANYTWKFTIVPAPDTTPPTIKTLSPINTAINVLRNKVITAKFSEPMDTSTINTNTFTISGVQGVVTYSDSTARITPLSLLEYNKQYTATITTGVKDKAGNALAAKSIWRFTTEQLQDTVAPMVLSINPINNATDISVNTIIAATFSEKMDSSSIKATTFTVSEISGAVVLYNGNIATFLPSTPFAANTPYTATLTTDVKDKAGNALISNYVWKFTTGSSQDIIEPTVLSVAPANNSTEIPINTKINVIFNEKMDASSINANTFTIGGVTGAITYNGVIASFTPSASLENNIKYTANITTGAKDNAGNGIATSYIWKFTTTPISDITPPTIINRNPPDKSTNILTNTSITATFSEPMDASTIDTGTFIIDGVQGTVTYSDSTATFTPSVFLEYDSTYKATLMNYIKDESGNALEPDTWYFKTRSVPDSTLPTIMAVDPINNTANVLRSAKVTAIFSEAMNLLTLDTTTFRINGVKGTVKYKDRIATFTPSALFEYNKKYTATITTGARDSTGNNPLESTYIWNFTTINKIRPRKAASGVYHNLMISNDGKLFAWGKNNYGQLGDGTMTDRPIPTQIGTASNWEDIGCGYEYSMAINSDGKLFGWGNNLNGQLGDGTATNRNSPTQIGTSADWEDIACGNNHTIATRSDGRLFAWGYNAYGQLGDTTYLSKYNPVQVGTSANWEYIACGNYHNMAINSDGKLFGWGNNTYGQLGDGTLTNRNRLTQIGTATDWKYVACGNYYSIGVKKDGKLFAWGYNANGQLGDGTTVDKITPIQIGTATDWAYVVCGYAHSMAIKNDGKLFVWGYNAYGQLGDGTVISRLTPTQISTAIDWKYIAGGYIHSIGIKNDGKIFTWGNNTYGQLGSETITNGSIPNLIELDLTAPTVLSTSPMNNATNIPVNTSINVTFSEKMDAVTLNTNTFTVGGVAGTVTYTGNTATFTPLSTLEYNTQYTVVITTGAKDFASRAITSNYTWQFTTGQDGTPPTIYSTNPANNAKNVLNVPRITATFSETMDSTTFNTNTFTVGGVTGIVSYNRRTAIFTPTSSLLDNTNYIATIKSGVKDKAGFLLASDYVWNFTIGNKSKWGKIASGQNHNLMIKSNGKLFAWGYNNYGQLGDGTTSERRFPTQIGTAADWAYVACGYYHSMAIKNDGSLYAWGGNGDYQLGDGTSINKNVPTQIGTATDWAFIACGYYHSIAIKNDGRLFAWGRNDSGQLGDGTNTDRYAPTQIGSDSDWVFVACGLDYSIGIKSDGRLFAWGLNSNLQLGDGTLTDRNVPTQIGTATDWAYVACGVSHTIATKSDGKLFAWGWNSDGQLGDGTTINRSVPTQIGTATDWAYVACGSNHTIAVKSDGRLFGWGWNNDGQLGDGTNIDKIVPTQIGTASDWAYVACGSNHSIGTKSDDKFFTWGDNYNSQLGDGTTVDKNVPNQLDLTAPVISSVSPINDETGVTVDKLITITFNEAMDGTSINTNTFSIAGVTGTVTYSGTTAAFTPSSTFEYNTQYTATITNAVKDISNNPLESGYAWLFTTAADTTPPTVKSTNPVSNARNVLNGSKIKATFSETMDPESINTNTFKIAGVTGTVTYSGRTATFTPISPLADDTNYSATITAGIKDIAGFSSISDYIWSFRIRNRSKLGKIANNTYHDLMITNNGKLFAWGRNNFGQLGLGDSTSQSIATQVGTDSTWAYVACGNFHSMAIKNDGSLFAWGNNVYSQLGNGTGVNANTPKQIGIDTDWAYIAAGIWYSMAIKSDGSLFAWGNNAFGQLGDGTQISVNTPKQIGTDADWAYLACGADFTMAIKSDGRLFAWGNNAYGQLGDGTTTTVLEPKQIGTETDWVYVDCGEYHTIAVKSDGRLFAWGRNNFGQLGDGTSTNVSAPKQIGTDTNWDYVACGNFYSMATKIDGKLYAWGDNTSRQLGDGTIASRNVPTQIGTDTDWTYIAGGYNSIGLKNDGKIYTWGSNAYGQVGNGSTVDQSVPIQLDYIIPTVSSVSPINNATNVAVNAVITATFSESMDTTSININTFKIAGVTGTVTYSGITATFTPSSNLEYNSTYIATITTGVKDSVGYSLASDYTWQFKTLVDIVPPTIISTTPANNAKNILNGFTIKATFSESMNTSSIDTTTFKIDGVIGTVTYSGKIATFTPIFPLADNTIYTATITTGVKDKAGNAMESNFSWNFTTINKSKWSKITSGQEYSLMITNDGRLFAWGRNDGQLGDGTLITRTEPMQIGIAIDWAYVNSGFGHSVAIKTDGKLYAWGNNLSGQLGDSTTTNRNVPTQIGTDTDWAYVACGYEHTIAIKNNGRLYAWGNNLSGQLGDSTTINRNVPTQIGTDTDWIYVACGYEHSIAIKSDGRLFAWGNNDFGQLGDGTITIAKIPKQIGPDENWAYIDSGAFSNIAIKNDGRLFAWGYNNSGQLGDGTIIDRNLPTQIGSDTNWAYVASAYDHSLGVKNDGRLFAWGKNEYSKLGDGTTNDRTIPTQIELDIDWVYVSCGYFHSIAIKLNGELYSWGHNVYGQLGDGTYTDSNIPIYINTY